MSRDLPVHQTVTNDQLKYVNALCKRLRLPLHLLDTHCQTTFGHPFVDLDRGQCSQLIDTLKAWTEIPAELQIAQGQLVMPGVSL